MSTSNMEKTTVQGGGSGAGGGYFRDVNLAVSSDPNLTGDVEQRTYYTGSNTSGAASLGPMIIWAVVAVVGLLAWNAFRKR